MARLPQISLTPTQYNPYVFEPQKVQGLKFDAPNIGGLMERNNNLMIQVGQQEEQRRKEADVAYQKFKTTMAGLREKLTDSKDRDWFDHVYLPRLKGEIDESSRNGDVGGALSKAVRLAGDAQNDIEFNARVDAEANWKEFSDRIKNNKNISDRIYDFWEDINKYDFDKQARRDENGNVIGYNDFVPDANFSNTGMPVEDLNWEEALGSIINVAHPTKTSSETENANSVSNRNDLHYGAYNQSSDSWSFKTSNGTVTLTTEQLWENANDYFNRTGHREAFMQEFAYNMWAMNKAQEKYNNATDPNSKELAKRDLEHYKQFLNKQGGIVSEKEFFVKMIGNTLKNASVHDTVSGSSSSSSKGRGRGVEDEYKKKYLNNPTNSTDDANGGNRQDTPTYHNQNTGEFTEEGRKALHRGEYFGPREVPSASDVATSVYGN